VRIALFTNNYLPFCGGVTISVETLRRGLAARSHDVWIFAPRLPGAPPDIPHLIRYPSIPAATYPEFALAFPYARGIATRVRALDVDVFHAHHPFLLGPAARRLARRARRPLVFTYHTRYEKYAHYVPLRRTLVEAAAIRLSTRFAARADAVIAPSAPIRDELLARLRRRRRDDEYSAADPAGWADLAGHPASAEEELVQLELRGLLARAIETLPEPYRLPLVLHHLEGLSNEAIAARLGLGLAAVKSRVYRSRILVRQCLAAYVAA